MHDLDVRQSRAVWATFTFLAVIMAAVLPVAGQIPYEITMSPWQSLITHAQPPLPSHPVQLVLDDDSPESTFGFSGAYSHQFLWFNQFADPGPFRLEEIWVLFPPGVDMAVGAPVDLVVFNDVDGDPTNGADLIATYPVTIQDVTGTTFSIYPVSLDLALSGDILVGVINRFTDPTSSPAGSEPAAIDTTTGQLRSWWALWNGGAVPAPASLPPDLALARLEQQNAGNWMIRAFGTTRSYPIPVLGAVGAVALVLLLVVLGAFLLRRPG